MIILFSYLYHSALQLLSSFCSLIVLSLHHHLKAVNINHMFEFISTKLLYRSLLILFNMYVNLFCLLFCLFVFILIQFKLILKYFLLLTLIVTALYDYSTIIVSAWSIIYPLLLILILFLFSYTLLLLYQIFVIILCILLIFIVMQIYMNLTPPLKRYFVFVNDLVLCSFFNLIFFILLMNNEMWLIV